MTMHYLNLLWENLGVVTVGFVGGMYFRQRALNLLNWLVGLL